MCRPEKHGSEEYKGGIAITLSMRCDVVEQEEYILKNLKKINYTSQPGVQYAGCSEIRNMKIWFSEPKRTTSNYSMCKRKRQRDSNKTTEKCQETVHTRPRGRAPNGCYWNETIGSWQKIVHNRPRGRCTCFSRLDFVWFTYIFL